jgi:hypothetical protein
VRAFGARRLSADRQIWVSRIKPSVVLMERGSPGAGAKHSFLLSCDDKSVHRHYECAAISAKLL